MLYPLPRPRTFVQTPTGNACRQIAGSAQWRWPCDVVSGLCCRPRATTHLLVANLPRCATRSSAPCSAQLRVRKLLQHCQCTHRQRSGLWSFGLSCLAGGNFVCMMFSVSSFASWKPLQKVMTVEMLLPCTLLSICCQSACLGYTWGCCVMLKREIRAMVDCTSVKQTIHRMVCLHSIPAHVLHRKRLAVSPGKADAQAAVQLC